jgi:CubicO group peptidase (beta-lactamase class C family)
MRHGKTLFTAFLIATLSVIAAAHAQANVATSDSAMITDVSRVMAERYIPGTQAAILSADEDVWEHSFGVRDLATSAPMAMDTL